MIHRIELSANDSALVARGCPLNVRVVALGNPVGVAEVRVVFTKKTWDQIRPTYNERLVRVTLGGS